jgi:predicted ATPase with chaperone activity
MEPSVAGEGGTGKDPYLPPLCKVGDLIGPRAPQDVAGAKLDEGNLSDLAIKLFFTVARFTTEWVAKRLHLSLALSRELLIQMCTDGIIEETMQTTQGRSHYKITARGREHASRLMEVCAYIGPAPVRLEAYSAMLRWQFQFQPEVTPEDVTSALEGLVLTPEAAQLAGLAVSSGRSLFVFGPPGNGKSSLGRAIHTALPGDYWIPYCISVGSNVIIRIYDEQAHQKIALTDERAPVAFDQRWVRIRRPMVIVGGELTIEMLDLMYSKTVRYYEAAPHLKANGGVFLVDDFGRERISPEQLLNRFITPMEHQIDYFTLNTGQKIVVPLRHVLIIATNLSPEKVTDPAFLRRMGYRCYLGAPTPEQYTKIFKQYAQKVGATIAPEMIDGILERYGAQNRELRCCEPRDIIERSRDICRFQKRELELTQEIIDLAWTGYFGNKAADQPDS